MCQNKRTKTSIYDQQIQHTKTRPTAATIDVIYDLNLTPLFISMCTYNMVIARLCAHFSFSQNKYKKQSEFIHAPMYLYMKQTSVLGLTKKALKK